MTNILFRWLPPQMTGAAGRRPKHLRGDRSIYKDVQFSLRVLLFAVALINLRKSLKIALAHTPERRRRQLVIRGPNSRHWTEVWEKPRSPQSLYYSLAMNVDNLLLDLFGKVLGNGHLFAIRCSWQGGGDLHGVCDLTQVHILRIQEARFSEG